ncbi:MAG: hypothetical protein OEV43_03125 [Coriobacteriia bacterium]|nr:hypothetical protein [Coriobacteriia bacterium]
MCDNKKDTDERRSSLGGAPDTPTPEDSAEDQRDRCAHDRPRLTPRQTADCAGTDLAEIYENEEDGGS